MQVNNPYMCSALQLGIAIISTYFVFKKFCRYFLVVRIKKTFFLNISHHENSLDLFTLYFADCIRKRPVFDIFSWTMDLTETSSVAISHRVYKTYRAKTFVANP